MINAFSADTKILWVAIVMALATSLFQLFQSLVLHRRNAEFDFALARTKSSEDEFNLRKAEARERALVQQLAFIDRQISELYGPLFSLIDQLDVVYTIEHGIVDSNHLNSEHKATVSNYLQKNYYSVVHNQIDSILQTKLYLIEGAAIPDAYREYVAHATQSDIQKSLWSDFGIATTHFEGARYPGDINAIIEDSLVAALDRKARLLNLREEL
jgi:hypothetical protein